MDRKHLYLHVGMDKTGSSAIQYFLQENRALLLEQGGPLYTQTGIWNDFSHHPFAFSIFGTHRYSPRKLKGLLKQWRKEMAPHDKVILSTECLFKASLREPYALFRDFVRESFAGLTVIVYVRRQDDWVESRHKHSVFSGSELTIEQLQRPFFCDYKQYIDLWADDFGQENVVVRPYEKQQFVGGSIFSDFLDCVDIEMTDQYRLPAKGVNLSLGNQEHAFKQLCNGLGSHFRKGGEINTVLLEHTQINTDSKNSGTLISAADRRRLVAEYTEVNNAIARDYVRGAAGPLFLDPLPTDKDGNDSFSGIKKDEIGEMLDFVSRANPGLMKTLGKAVRKGMMSSDPAVVGAAKSLSLAD